MPDQYKQYEAMQDRQAMPGQHSQHNQHNQHSLETSPPTTPTSDIIELENQPPISPTSPMSPSLSQSLSHSLSSTPLTVPSLGGNGIHPIRAPIHRSSQLAMKVKQEVTEKKEKIDNNCKYYQSIPNSDPFRCDTNNNSNKNTSNSNKSYDKTTIAKQILSVIRNDDFEEFLIILRSKPDLNVFINGQTALHYCLLLGRDVSWCRQLVLNGANPNLSNHDGWHPLHLAASIGHNEILSYLINHSK